ncbi:MAG: electron transfer flavoprotein subunit beta/FixA family protein [Oscillospiraceae bacterium]|jgi:electron transfer flavoprotein beta subunit|nr:electron transfer flavoprotein subunit beta/FixA family protein [Oscillospiraceae bacterium]
MKIVVCIKQVPDTTEIRLDPVNGTLIRDGVPSVMNPDDKAGLEQALRLKESAGAKVTVLSMGPPQAEVMMREALAMGADRAVLLSSRAFAGSDTLATSSALAAAIRKLEYDLIITGRQAIDGDTAQVGPQIAEHLDIPNISYAEQVTPEKGGLRVKRSFEDRYQIQRVRFPCLITALSDLARPRYMTPGGIFDAFRVRVVERWTDADIEADPTQLGLDGSPTRVKKSFPKSVKPAGVVTHAEGRAAAELIVGKLKERFIL